MKNRWLLPALLVSGVCATAAMAEGRLEGVVAQADGEPLAGVAVVIHETGEAAVSDRYGAFAFRGVPAGTYTVIFTLGGNSVTEQGVKVEDGITATIEMKVDWEIAFAETITVYSASRRLERVVDAPAAVTVVDEETIQQQASHGQAPKLLEFTPGAELTQSGIYDFNFNTRGFNSSLNRRVATLIDGRDPSVPFLGAQEWSAVATPLDDLASVEFVRGPSAALYGKNAASGVLNLTSRAPRYSEGGIFRLTGGELDTLNADLRWAGALGNDWYLKVNGGSRNHEDFFVSRNQTAEYSTLCTVTGQTNCLPREAVPVDRDDDEIWFGSLRADKYFGADKVLTLEGGTADVAGPVTQTGIGRVQLLDVKRPWGRINFNMPHWNFMLATTRRDAPRQLGLSSGANLSLDGEALQAEAQGNWNFLGDKLRFVAGVFYRDDDIDTADPDTGRQTLTFAPVSEDYNGGYGQVDWNATDRIKLVFAARYDDSSLYDAQFSPKAAVLYSVSPDHSLRLTYNEAFQVPNYSEYFLQGDVAAPLNLAGIEAALCTPFAVSCGFATPTRILAVGNANLELEETRTIELGYTGIISKRSYVTADYYMSQNENFVTDLLPQLGTALGRINPDFAAYQAPANHPMPALLISTLQGALGPSYAFLSNNFDDSPLLAVRSYANFGDVDSQGVELGLTQFISKEWKLNVAYSWFDFDIQEDLPGFANLLVPNTPEHQAAAGISYGDGRIDYGFSVRWVDDFQWAVGPFVGPVESYVVADLHANYRIGEDWKVGANAANMFDNDHYEAFGGDLLGSRYLIYVAYEWGQ